MNCERAVLFPVKRDLYPPPPLYHPHSTVSLTILLLAGRDDQDLEISLKAKLLNETWNANLTNNLHDDFIQLEERITSKVSFKPHD